MFNDLTVISRIKEGNVKAFETVFRLYYAPLCVYASCITGSHDASEEIVQELFYVLWRDRNKLHVLNSMKNYLYGAVRNQSLQYLEHEEVKRRYDEMVMAQKDNDVQSIDPSKQMECEELQRMIDETLMQLPSRCAQIFSMHRFQAKKYSEIAENLQISIKTVEAEMSKAIKMIRAKVELYFK